MRKGIAIAGNILVDYVKLTDTYPAPGMLANISGASRAVGGCVPNTIMDLAKMGLDIPLTALGRIGNDEAGRYVEKQMRDSGVNTAGLVLSQSAATSFSDAFCAADTGERTFFHYRGANAEFSPADLDLDHLSCALLHVGYLLLLDRFDQKDDQYGTVMARFLHDAQARGMMTSIDAVSDGRGRFRETILPALRYCDYAIMNEIEGCAMANLPPRKADGRLNIENIRQTLHRFMDAGVRQMAVLHSPMAAFSMDKDRHFTLSPSFKLPDGYIKGSVGAGDAFAAGCLAGIVQGMDAQSMLSLGAAAAAANLSAADSVSGMKPYPQLVKMINEGARIDHETI